MADGQAVDHITLSRREDMAQYEWDNERKQWARPDVDAKTLKELSERSTINGLVRIAFFVVCLGAAAVATILVSRISSWLAIPVIYIYFSLYGFWVAIAHEMQHQTAFAKSANWLNEILFFFIQVLMWNSPRYARVSHKLHHRYTMIEGMDPETDWPETITSAWLRKFLRARILSILAFGAVRDLALAAKKQLWRAIGKKEWMMRDHCSPQDNLVIRIESAAILLIHVAVVVIAILFRRWELLALVTIAWQIGSPVEAIWHATKHLSRPKNVNDHRLNTRSIKVGPFTKLIFWGLDDHVDHHLYPIVPSRNLPKLHKILATQLPTPKNVIGCWDEMFAIAHEKETHPGAEFVSVGAATESAEVGVQ